VHVDRPLVALDDPGGRLGEGAAGDQRDPAGALSD